MAHADDGSPGPSRNPRPSRSRPAWFKGMICLAFVPLAAFIAQGGLSLWREWSALRRDRVGVEKSALIGYININPIPSHARRPREWIVAEGDQAKIWAVWDGRDHRWFRYERPGAIDPKLLSLPLGRDVIQAVDRPIHEESGGALWARIPDDAPVVGVVIGGRASIYPIKVLEKVEAVNDRLGDRPVLVAYTPFEGRVTTYERSVSGREVVLGHSGYFHGHDPILYDRETESLWVARGDRMAAVAGRRRGESLPRIGQVPTQTWATCRAENPRGRLMVGARRDYDPTTR